MSASPRYKTTVSIYCVSGHCLIACTTELANHAYNISQRKCTLIYGAIFYCGYSICSPGFKCWIHPYLSWLFHWHWGNHVTVLFQELTLTDNIRISSINSDNKVNFLSLSVSLYYMTICSFLHVMGNFIEIKLDIVGCSFLRNLLWVVLANIVKWITEQHHMTIVISESLVYICCSFEFISFSLDFHYTSIYLYI